MLDEGGLVKKFGVTYVVVCVCVKGICEQGRRVTVEGRPAPKKHSRQDAAPTRKMYDMNKITAKDIMSKDIIWVKASTSLEDLAMLFCERSITGEPVMDDVGQVVGVVSRSDVVNYTNALAERGEGLDLSLATVKDIMTPTIFSVEETASLLSLIETMIEHDVHRLMVKRSEQIVGIITTGDLLRVIAERLRG